MESSAYDLPESLQREHLAIHRHTVYNGGEVSEEHWSVYLIGKGMLIESEDTVEAALRKAAVLVLSG